MFNTSEYIRLIILFRTDAALKISAKKTLSLKIALRAIYNNLRNVT